MKPQRVLASGLLIGCALLAAAWVALVAGVGQGVEVPAPRAPQGGPAAAGAEEEDFALPAFETYAEVMNRPLFNEDRRPIVEATELDDEDESTEADQVATLNVTVTGIIITPDQKLAMVTNNVSREPLRLREGMPLDGDQASWTLSSIEPRHLVFDGGSQGTAVAKLETFTQPLKGGAPPPARRTAAADASKQETETQNAADSSANSDATRAARAEEIRRRVAERRAELRAEAERRRAEAQQDDDG